MAAKWNRTRIFIGDGFKKADREAIATDIVNYIIERSKSGTGFNPETGRNKGFVRYSKEYAKRKGQSNVDLTLSDQMLKDIRVLSMKTDSILIGFENGTESNAKADGNQTGSYGRSPNPAKARPFLGLTKKDLNDILIHYERDQ